MSKNILYFFIIFIFCIGCSKNNSKNNINTIIEEDKNILVSMNYPTTGYKKIDNIIKNDIKNIYNNFKNKYEDFSDLDNKSELNIDYTYNIINKKYLSITLNIFIDSSKLDKEINYIKTYFYNKNNKKLMNLDDLIDKKNINIINKYVKNKLVNKYSNCINLNNLDNLNYDLFSIDNDNLYLYFNDSSYCGLIDIAVPLNKFKLKINIKENNENYKTSKEVIHTIDPNKKAVALTFDDGPSIYTNELLDILKKENVVATFFVIGNKVKIYNKELIKAINNGNEIGNHSYNHKWMTKLSIEDFKKQISMTQDIIYDTTGYTPTCFRPTYGSINSNIRNNINLNIVMWNVDTMDWKYKSVDKIVSRATSKTKDLDIILMHDTRKRTIEAVKKIIPKLKSQGFEFVTVSDLEEIKKLRSYNE